MQARPENRGKLTRCGGCQAVFPIPDQAPPDVPKPVLPPPVKRRLPRAVPWGGTAVAAVFLLVGLVTMWPRSMAQPKLDPNDGGTSIILEGNSKPPVDPPPDPPPPPVSDLAFLPTEGRAILSIRIADFWKSKPIQSVWEKLPAEVRAQSEEANRQFGFEIEDYERVTVVIEDDVKEEAWVVLKTVVPLDRERREKILSGAKGVSWKKKSYRGLEYQVVTASGPDAPKPLGVYLASDQVFVLAAEGVIEVALEHYLRGKEGKPGPLARAIPLIEAGKSHVVMCATMTPQDRKELARIPAWLAPAFAGGGPSDVETVLVTARFEAKLEAEGTMTFGDEAKARAYRDNFERLKAAGKPLVQFSGPGSEGLMQLVKSLTDIETAVEGRTVVLSGKLDIDKLAPALSGAVVVKGIDHFEKQSGVENLKKLALAFEEYHTKHKRYPKAVYRSPTGKPLYSWRVAILPHLGQQALYDRFDPKLAWNEGKNKELIALMPAVFAHPGQKPGEYVGQTTFQLLTGPRSAFANDAAPQKADLKGRSSQLLLMTVSKMVVPWTAPIDLELPDDAARVEKEIVPLLGAILGMPVPAVRFDQSVRKLTLKITGRELLEGIDPSSR